MIWEGRNDGENPLHHRVFQRVQRLSEIDEIHENDFVLHGFTVDEGVRRNKGRVGAKHAPDIIRSQMVNFPVVNAEFKLWDAGNVGCEDGNLEMAQNILAQQVSDVLRAKGKSVVLGGGHEVTFAHYSGIRNAFPQSKIGILNIDAHFDNRKPEQGASSGTGFWQIAEEGAIQSLHIGIQRNSNTLHLFDTAHETGMKYILADEIFYEKLVFIYEQIDALVASVDVLYLTVCMDVFNASIAPGVSALAYNGIFADPTFMTFFRHILKQPKLVAMDVAEVNPEFDIQNRTARLAASLVNEWFMI